MPKQVETKHRASLPMQTRLARIEKPSAAADTDAAIELTWSSGAQVRRYDWWKDEEFYEALDLAGADLTRLNGGAPVLDSHRSWGLDSVIGVVERAWVEGQEGKATIRLSQRPEVAGIRADIAAGILRNVSIGYAVHEVERIRAERKGEPDTVRVTRFEPMEISIVPVPADAGAQVQRDGKANAYPLVIRSIEDMPMSATTEAVAEESVTETTAPPVEAEISADSGNAAPEEAIAEAHRSAVEAERQRAQEIVALCARHHASEQASDFIARGLNLDQVRGEMLRQYETGNGPELRPGITRSHGTGSWNAVIEKLNKGTHQ